MNRQLSRASRVCVAALAILMLASSPGAAQVASESVDLDVVRRIREEGFERSQLAELAGWLMDVIGPRLTGSPAMRRANEWTAQKFREWGLAAVTIEPWGEFGRGWERAYYAGMILTPYAQPLIAQPIAWTGSTNGTVRGSARLVVVDSMADLATYAGELAGAMVLTSPPIAMEPVFDPEPLRTPLEELFEPRQTETGAEREARYAEYRRKREWQQGVDSALAAEGVAAILKPSDRAYSLVRGGGNGAGRDPARPVPPPELVVAAEQYNQIYRNVARGLPVELEINIQNRFYDNDLMAYNTLAEIPGTDLADEYVMIGGHLDSWHYGTGATDNGAGSVVMMEAIRILQALDLQPRRTIRIALWSGEEQGIYGSEAWLANHPELHARISAYLNVDNGSGRLRGIWDQSNERAIPIFEQLLWPFRDLGVVAVKHGDTGGTDHLSFDEAGVPGFNFIQDPIDYGTHTHHTTADTFERLLLDDLRQAAVVVAATAYHLAMRDKMMPRKPPEEEPTQD